jgi:hypothetical protein
LAAPGIDAGDRLVPSREDSDKRSVRRYRPTHGTVVAYLALFVALGGSATALSGRNSVDSGDIINGQVKTQDVANDTTTAALQGKDISNANGGTLTGNDILESSLAQVPAAANADKLDNIDSTGFLQNGAAAGGDLTGTYPNPTIAANAIGSAEVTDQALSSGDIADRSRAISIPLASFIDCQTDAGAFLDFTSGVDSIPDFTNSTTDGQGFVIRFDATSGSPDQDSEICSQLTLPPDYESDGEFRLRFSKPSTSGASEDLSSAVSVNGGALSPVATFTGCCFATSGTVTLTPAFSGAPYRSLSFYLAVNSPTTIDNLIDIQSVEFVYIATS